MLIDKNFTWENHVDALSKKIASGVGAIKCINYCLPPTALHDVYYGLVESPFDYCSTVLDNCSKTLHDKWQRLQNRAAHILTNSNYDADASILLNDLGWQNLETQQQIQKAVMVYKSLNCLAPDYIQNSYDTVIYLIPTTLEMLKISLLFPCHEPVNIEIAFATAGLFCGTICPLM